MIRAHHPPKPEKIIEGKTWVKTKSGYRSLDKINHWRLLDYYGVHLACGLAFFTGVSWVALAICIGFYYIRMFAITGWYHRYFSHKSFKTSRTVQFIFAYLGNTSAQRSALWWAAHHRHHHRFSDKPEDSHSPIQQGFLRSHMFWFMTPDNKKIKWDNIKDLTKFPELMWLNKNQWLAPISSALFMVLLGAGLEFFAPQLHTNAWQMLVWGFFISTTLCFHGTYTINSLGHMFGSRRYKTEDDSRNNFWLSLITMGEGWHNNHHYYQNSARQGFYWWEIDMSYYLLWTMSKLGLVWDLKPVPLRIREKWREQTSYTVIKPERLVEDASSDGSAEDLK